MKTLYRNAGILIVALIVTLSFIYQKEVRNTFFKEDIYIFFDMENHARRNLNWSKHSNLFPKKFDPKMILIDSEELLKLNSTQKRLYDSIKNSFYKYPQKSIHLEKNIIKYNIEVNPNLSVSFEPKKTTPIDFHKIESYNELPLDSIIKIIPGIFSIKKEKRHNKIRFNIIVLDKENKEATLSVVEPIISELN